MMLTVLKALAAALILTVTMTAPEIEERRPHIHHELEVEADPSRPEIE